MTPIDMAQALPERSCIRHRDQALDSGKLDLAVEWDELLNALKEGYNRLTIMRKMVMLLAEEKRPDIQPKCV